MPTGSPTEIEADSRARPLQLAWRECSQSSLESSHAAVAFAAGWFLATKGVVQILCGLPPVQGKQEGVKTLHIKIPHSTPYWDRQRHHPVVTWSDQPRRRWWAVARLFSTCEPFGQGKCRDKPGEIFTNCKMLSVGDFFRSLERQTWPKALGQHQSKHCSQRAQTCPESEEFSRNYLKALNDRTTNSETILCASSENQNHQTARCKHPTHTK